MTAEDRIQKRHEIFMGIFLEMQLFNRFTTYGTFLDEFERRVARDLGECTEEDKAWGFERLDWTVKRNSEPEKVDRRRRENRGKKKEDSQ